MADVLIENATVITVDANRRVIEDGAVAIARGGRHGDARHRVELVQVFLWIALLVNVPSNGKVLLSR